MGGEDVYSALKNRRGDLEGAERIGNWFWMDLDYVYSFNIDQSRGLDGRTIWTIGRLGCRKARLGQAISNFPALNTLSLLQ